MQKIRFRGWFQEKWFFLVFLTISLPLLLFNLGKAPFIEDEGIRGLVALEMWHSGEYFAPTLYGEYYFKKPPLWNWILLTSYRIFGEATEFSSRVPTVLFLLIFTLSIYLIYRRILNERQAVLNALVFLTCGRILFWDSMLALIDISFSWLIFLIFIWIFYWLKHEKWIWLFAGAYLLASLAFLLKALPAVVFLGLTLSGSLLYYKKWRQLFSGAHFLGIAIFSLIISGYFLAFSEHQPIEKLLSIFFDESTQRTALRHGFMKVIFQLVTFPLEMVYHFLPWSALTILFFYGRTPELLRQNRFVSYLSLVFLVNIWVYWTSPQVFPRYLIMFCPLYFGVGIYLYEHTTGTSWRKAVDIILLLLGLVVLTGSGLVFWHEKASQLPGLTWKWSISAMLMGISLILLRCYRTFRIHAFCLFLLSARLGYDLIVLPSRGAWSTGQATRSDSFRIAEKTQGKELSLHSGTYLRYEIGFYLTARRGQPIRTVSSPADGAFILTDQGNYSTLQGHFEKVDSIRLREENSFIFLLKEGQD